MANSISNQRTIRLRVEEQAETPPDVEQAPSSVAADAEGPETVERPQQTATPQSAAAARLAHRYDPRLQQLQHAAHQQVDAAAAGNGSFDSNFRSDFADLASSAQDFHDVLRNSFGDGYNQERAEGLREQALANDFSWLPNVRLVDASTLEGGLGAYESSSGTIYIDKSLQGTSQGSRVFAEEVGHHLDSLLNDTDTKGDEGELFQHLLAGDSLSPDQMREIRSDDDQGTINVDGQTRDVEFSWVSDELRRGGRRIDRNLIRPIRDTFIVPAVEVLDEGRDMVRRTLNDVGDARADILRGDVREGVGELAAAPSRLAGDVVGLAIDGTVVKASKALDVVDSVFNLGEERGLTGDEINYLRPIYGDSLDYGRIRLQRGGALDSVLNPSNANAVGNEIRFPTGEGLFRDGGLLTPDGLRLLGHEAAHVWQFQNRGIGYLSDSLGEQIASGPGPDPYNWRRAVRNLSTLR